MFVHEHNDPEPQHEAVNSEQFVFLNSRFQSPPLSSLYIPHHVANSQYASSSPESFLFQGYQGTSTYSQSLSSTLRRGRRKPVQLIRISHSSSNRSLVSTFSTLTFHFPSSSIHLAPTHLIPNLVNR